MPSLTPYRRAELQLQLSAARDELASVMGVSRAAVDRVCAVAGPVDREQLRAAWKQLMEC